MKALIVKDGYLIEGEPLKEEAGGMVVLTRVLVFSRETGNRIKYLPSYLLSVEEMERTTLTQ